ncbi:RNA-binding S4 domain-containing protein [Chelativorans sp. ZYF759]|uniref:RNA-binding S4 domain-containing protein n=1 Tax=Chelativorans sp. ZYF759 TaxID=2692213 RepID=UPI00145FB0D4|nr:RNA-binding S4 domain-containing protein [Chelativorans sp. ZYF759]NMG40696.1 RNA-binding S4 domain-containing protein [Chelativorans sp. ZYF759]
MAEAGRQRIDRWLFFARVVKSRSLAARLVAAGKIRRNRDKLELPSGQVGPGDVLTITLERRVLVYRVLAPGSRRGPAEEARLLYEDLTPPAESRPSPVDETAPRDHGAGRPTKKERRALDRLRDAE